MLADYDLNRVFDDSTTVYCQLFTASETIEEDPFLSSDAFQRYGEYIKGTDRLKKLIGEKQVEGLDDGMLKDYLLLNPHHYYPYFLAGEIHRLKGNNQLAREMYNKSLSKEIPRMVDRKVVTEAMERLRK